MDKLDYRARAKINLGLDVCRRLENGYHEVKMILQSVNIYDELTFQKRTTPDVVLSVQSKDYLGDLNSNLIVRAANLMKQQYNISDGQHFFRQHYKIQKIFQWQQEWREEVQMLRLQ